MATLEVQPSHLPGGVHDQDMSEEDAELEAVGLGAAEELTGPAVPRQEQ